MSDESKIASGYALSKKCELAVQDLIIKLGPELHTVSHISSKFENNGIEYMLGTLWNEPINGKTYVVMVNDWVSLKLKYKEKFGVIYIVRTIEGVKKYGKTVEEAFEGIQDKDYTYNLKFITKEIWGESVNYYPYLPDFDIVRISRHKKINNSWF